MAHSSSQGVKRFFTRWLSGSSRSQAHYSYTQHLKRTYGDLGAYSDIQTQAAQRTPHPTRHEIRCHPDLPFGCSLGALIKRFGTPQHRVPRPNDLTDAIAAYRQQWSGHKVKSEFHFSADGLFYFNQSFPYLSHGERETVARYFIGNYCGEEQVDLDEEKLADDKGHEIIFTRDVVFSIHYLDRQSPALAGESG